jgi:hypothetical protein
MRGCRLDSSHSGLMSGSCEHCNEPSRSIKQRGMLQLFSKHHILMWDLSHSIRQTMKRKMYFKQSELCMTFSTERPNLQTILWHLCYHVEKYLQHKILLSAVSRVTTYLNFMWDSNSQM